MFKWLAIGFSVLLTASINTASAVGEAQTVKLPFKLQVIDQETLTATKFPPPGIAWVGDSITIVAPMDLGDSCSAPNVEVRSTQGRSSNETFITVDLLGVLSRRSKGELCMQEIQNVYVIVTIPDLPPGKYSINVRGSLYSVNIILPNRGGRISSEGSIVQWP
jgi:hypothetical protein